jgi:hypothetical protein
VIPEPLSARGFKLNFIAHVKTHGFPLSHELEAMIAARQIPRKCIGLARRARAALDEADALPDGDSRRDELIDIGDDIVGAWSNKKKARCAAQYKGLLVTI